MGAIALVGGEASTALLAPDSSNSSAIVGVAAASSTDEAFSILASIGDGLEGLHAASGLPWWGTIILATLGVRTALLPVVWYQAKEGAKLAAAGPELDYLYKLTQAELAKCDPRDTDKRMNVLKLFMTGARGIWKLKD